MRFIVRSWSNTLKNRILIFILKKDKLPSIPEYVSGMNVQLRPVGVDKNNCDHGKTLNFGGSLISLKK